MDDMCFLIACNSLNLVSSRKGWKHVCFLQPHSRESINLLMHFLEKKLPYDVAHGPFLF